MADPFHDALCAAKRPTAGERELETVKAMLEAGADVNQCDCSISKTPLDCCAAYSGACSEHLMTKPMEAGECNVYMTHPPPLAPPPIVSDN